MENPADGRGGVGRTEGARALIARVERLARSDGLEVPGLNHWLVVVGTRELLARTIARGADVIRARAEARAALDRGEPGPPLPAAELEALAAPIALARDAISLHEWDLVRAVLVRAGIARPELASGGPDPGPTASGLDAATGSAAPQPDPMPASALPAAAGSTPPSPEPGATPVAATRPPSRRTPPPDAAAPEPATAAPDPATAEPDPATAAPDPATAAPDPATAPTDPATAAPDPATTPTDAPRPGDGQPDPATTRGDQQGRPPTARRTPEGTPTFGQPPPRRRGGTQPGQAAAHAPTATVEAATPALDRYGTDLTAAARRGEIPPVVGRDLETARIIETLCRPTKPNPMLVGEPGVGKSALVEGLARRIVAGDVPEMLRGRRVISIEMTALISNARYYGDIEERLNAVVGEARRARAILFFDEAHAMIAAGGHEGTGDVATLLKPVLARGTLPIISATTDDEYRRFIAANGALERRFVVIRVGEPGPDAVREILRSLRDAAAEHHGVWIDDEALEHVLGLSAIRFPHRRQPDKAKDLLEQAVAAAAAASEMLVTRAAIEAAADRLAGAPAVDPARLDALRQALVERGLLGADDAAALVDRLGLVLAGLDLRPERPRAVVLLVSDPSAAGDGALAEALAEFVFGSPDEVVSVDLTPVTDPAQLSVLLGTPQGYVGHGAALPLHRIAQKPYSVVRLTGLESCHAIARTVVAQAIRAGAFVDGTGRAIVLSSTIVLLEAARSGSRSGGRLGFAPEAGGAAAGAVGAAAGALRSLALASVGEELEAECDMVLAPASGAATGAWLIARVLGDLAQRYALAGIDLTWDPAAAVALAERTGRRAGRRARERTVEEIVGRVIQVCRRETVGRRLRAHLVAAASGAAEAIEATAP